MGAGGSSGGLERDPLSRRCSSVARLRCGYWERLWLGHGAYVDRVRCDLSPTLLQVSPEEISVELPAT